MFEDNQMNPYLKIRKTTSKLTKSQQQNSSQAINLKQEVAAKKH
jgi:hypothetical protein